MFLSSNRIHNLNVNDNDKVLLLEILKMKLSVASVEQMELYTDTQKMRSSYSCSKCFTPKECPFLCHNGRACFFSNSQGQ